MHIPEFKVLGVGLEGGGGRLIARLKIITRMMGKVGECRCSTCGHLVERVGMIGRILGIRGEESSTERLVLAT